jgi:hypothetical protein
MKFLKYLRFTTYSLGLFFTPFLLLICDVRAAELQGKFQDWSIFKTKREDRSICYLASVPIKRDGNYDKRGEPFFLVTNIQNDADEISIASGFIYSDKSNVEISFSSKKFYLFPYKALAWADSRSDDLDIIKELQKHDDFVVTAIARDGKIAADIYSLVGFSKAYEKMKQICKD